MTNATAERYQYTQEELAGLARSLFGDDARLWAFVCPNCGDVATAQDFKAIDADPHKIGQECIGRSLGALDKPKPTNARGCNWVAYGLFHGPWLITLPNGKEVGSFKLATVTA